MVDWDWGTRPTYESERIGIDATQSPLVLYDMLRPRQLEDREIQLMLSVAEERLDKGLPFLGLVRQRRGTGVISARHRKIFADWLDEHRAQLTEAGFGIVVVMPEAIYRAVLRVVYRFKAPPLRTITTSDLGSAIDAVRVELTAAGGALSPGLDAFLERLDRGACSSSA